MILLNKLEALNDELFHEDSSRDFSANIDEVAKKSLIWRIFLGVFIKNIKSKGFLNVLASKDIQSVDTIFFDHFDVFKIPGIFIDLRNVFFKEVDSELFVSVICGDFSDKIINFFEGSLMFSFSVLPDHFDILLHFVVSLVEVLYEFGGFFYELRVIVCEKNIEEFFVFDPFGESSVFDNVEGLSLFVKLHFSLDKFLEGSDSSKFLFEEWACDHFEVKFHFNESAPILDIRFYRRLSADLNDLTNQLYDFMMVQILHLFVSEELDIFFSD